LTPLPQLFSRPDNAGAIPKNRFQITRDNIFLPREKKNCKKIIIFFQANQAPQYPLSSACANGVILLQL
jgi:hypothetical protein